MEEAAGAVPLLADPIAVLARLRILPDQVAPERIALARDQVYEWADRPAWSRTLAPMPSTSGCRRRSR